MRHRNSCENGPSLIFCEMRADNVKIRSKVTPQGLQDIASLPLPVIGTKCSVDIT